MALSWVQGGIQGFNAYGSTYTSMPAQPAGTTLIRIVAMLGGGGTVDTEYIDGLDWHPGEAPMNQLYLVPSSQSTNPPPTTGLIVHRWVQPINYLWMPSSGAFNSDFSPWGVPTCWFGGNVEDFQVNRGLASPLQNGWRLWWNIPRMISLTAAVQAVWRNYTFSNLRMLVDTP